MRALTIGLITWFSFSATVAFADDLPGAASLDELARKVIMALDDEDYPAILALMIPPPVKSEVHIVNVAWYEDQRANMLEIATAHRQILADRKQLPLKEHIVTVPQIQFLDPPRKYTPRNGKEIEYGIGSVAGSNSTTINLFGVAAAHGGRWYLERMSSRGDELRINHLRGIYGSKLPIQLDDKSYPLPDGWVVPDETSLPPGMPVQYFDTRSKTFKSAEFLSGQHGHRRIIYLPGEDGMAGETLYVEYVIVAVDTLKQSDKDPTAFKLSVRLLHPESDVLLPENLIPITAETPLVLGTPIKEYIRTGPTPVWETRIVVEPIKDNSVRIMDKLWHRYYGSEELTKYAIEKSVVERLQQPGAAQEFEPLYIDALEQGAKQMIAEDVKKYPITLLHPEGYIPLPENEFVARGTRLFVEETDHRTWKTGVAFVDSQAGPLVLVWEADIEPRPEALQRSSTLMFDRKALNQSDQPPHPERGSPSMLMIDSNAAKPQPGTFEVVLLKSENKDFRVVKAISEIVGVDLQDALRITREVPISLRKNLTVADAYKLQQQLEAAGGTAKIQAMSIAQ